MENAIVTPRERGLTVGNISTIESKVQAVFPFLSTIKQCHPTTLGSPGGLHHGIIRCRYRQRRGRAVVT
jgi:hypothetical protein